MTPLMKGALVTTLTRHGDSLALVIDKPMLDLLGIGEETSLQLVTDGKGIFISPVDSDRHAKFREAAEDTFSRYPNMLKRLAQ